MMFFFLFIQCSYFFVSQGKCFLFKNMNAFK